MLGRRFANNVYLGNARKETNQPRTDPADRFLVCTTSLFIEYAQDSIIFGAVKMKCP